MGNIPWAQVFTIAGGIVVAALVIGLFGSFARR